MQRQILQHLREKPYGPDLINSLVGVLCRFRKEAVAVICDIEKMFHQFHVSPELWNCLRFLWWEGGDLEKEPREYRMAVHLFGTASSPGCANFGLKYLAQQHKVDYPSASAFIEKNFYVDNGLTSVPTVKEAKKVIIEAQELCKSAGLRLHKFNSNQREALSCVAPSERAVTTELLNLNPDATPEGRALSIQWSIEKDTFSFNIDLKDQPSTRRGILSVVTSLYNPLGFVAPFTLSGKCILQELCHKGIGWDDPLLENLIPLWEEWKNGLQRLKEITVPRCYHPPDFSNIIRIEPHHFSDASNVGYGACSYIRKLRRPAEEQRMAELPRECIEVSAPFAYCGMDYFGPFVIKKGRKEHKRYDLILTCLSSRAVHIEMLEDLSADSLINALRCFITLRGAVRQLHYDCGTNFLGARNEFREALKQCDSNVLEAFLADKQCKFIFNAPSASHAGGVWERQIWTVRNVLNVTIAQCPGRLDDASLRTLFSEAMAIVNSQPLIVDAINDPKSLEPLTPNHLILMKSKIALPPAGKFVKEDMYATKRWC
ncbi:hypothetical protein LDENG_00190950 [Lucifuga dentata]|nr:hypothetical protein LDENG_00190950 [Lucifuga dentata]